MGEKNAMNLSNDSLYSTLVKGVLTVPTLGDCPNLEFDVTGENINWENVDAKDGWLLQKYPVPNGYFRILDKQGIRKAWGSERAMVEKFKRLTRAEFLEPGDVIGVTRTVYLGLIDHYAVYIGNGRVIHFSKTRGKIRINEAPMSEFLGIEKEYFVLLFGEKEVPPVKIYCSTNKIFSEGLVINTLTLSNFNNYKLYTPEETIERAKEVASQDDEHQRKYDFLMNNCEHFAIWCKTGVAESYQVSRALDSLLGPVDKLLLQKYLI